MKITVLLRNDHDELKALLNNFQKPSTRNQNGKKELFNEISQRILIHSQMESEIFYPALAATPSPRATELVSAAQTEHQAIEELLQELNGMNGSDKSFESQVNRLIDAVKEHIEEEDEIFDEARKAFPEYRLEELGLEMEDRRTLLNTLAA